MKILRQVLLCVLMIGSFAAALLGQENDLSGFELSIDQDRFVDGFRDEPYENRNYAVGLRLGIYGEYANHPYLGLPWVREKIDGFLIDKILDNRGFRLENRSHNFVLTINGFSPSFISDEGEIFADAVQRGYLFETDRPFSSFTGFRSTRRLEGNKLFVHSTHQLDMAINTSFTFGLASIGIVQGVENLFGGNRPDAILWDEDEDKAFPTGQLIHRPMPIFMYSISAEAVVWQPIRKVLLQVRPELNLGYYTNVGFGIDFGKVMNVERLIDNLSYTDTHNPSLLAVNNDNLSFSLVGGVTARAVLYNAHLNGFYTWNAREGVSFADTRKLLLEGYVGVKIQLFQKIEFTYSYNRRTQEFKSDNITRRPSWGTIGFKYLLAPPGEGCYN